MWRSAVVPGWGQLYNGRPVKAVLFAAGQVYLGARAISESRLAGRLEDEALGIEEQGVADAKWRERNRALGRRDDFIWWSAFALLFSVAEAYVDASLIGFGEEFEGVRELPAPERTTKLGFTFTFE